MPKVAVTDNVVDALMAEVEQKIVINGIGAVAIEEVDEVLYAEKYPRKVANDMEQLLERVGSLNASKVMTIGMRRVGSVEEQERKLKYFADRVRRSVSKRFGKKGYSVSQNFKGNHVSVQVVKGGRQ